MDERKCKGCGGPIVGRSKQARFCSDACRTKYGNDKKPRTWTPKIAYCPVCDNDFVTHHYNQKMCSKECATERNKALCKRWDQNNKDKKKAYNARKWAENKDWYRDNSFKQRYGMSLDDARKRVEKQDHKCAICSDFIDLDSPGINGPNKAHVDHCHKTGAIRDMLCRECNWMLGNGRDEPARLLAGHHYLVRWNNVK